MSRSARTTKKQKKFVINFLSENQLLLGGKINPLDLTKVDKLWEKLRKEANELGPPKTIKQWKKSISEMKTNARRRARDVRYGTSGTGGGAGVKPLSDLEERLLSLLSHLTVEGDDLLKAGVVIHKDIDKMPIYIDEMQEVNKISTNGGLGEAGDNNKNSSNYVITGIDDTLSQIMCQGNKRIKHSRKILKNRSKGVALEERDKTLRQLAKSNYRLAQSIHVLARALNRVANKL